MQSEAKGEGQKKDEREIQPFVLKLFDIVCEHDILPVIDWNLAGDRFIIWDLEALIGDTVPTNFLRKNTHTFLEQLAAHGFQQSGSDPLEFQHPLFQRDNPRRLNQILPSRASDSPDRNVGLAVQLAGCNVPNLSLGRSVDLRLPAVPHSVLSPPRRSGQDEDSVEPWYGAKQAGAAEQTARAQAGREEGRSSSDVAGRRLGALDLTAQDVQGAYARNASQGSGCIVDGREYQHSLFRPGFTTQMNKSVPESVPKTAPKHPHSSLGPAVAAAAECNVSDPTHEDVMDQGLPFQSLAALPNQVLAPLPSTPPSAVAYLAPLMSPRVPFSGSELIPRSLTAAPHQGMSHPVSGFTHPPFILNLSRRDPPHPVKQPSAATQQSAPAYAHLVTGRHPATVAVQRPGASMHLSVQAQLTGADAAGTPLGGVPPSHPGAAAWGTAQHTEETLTVPGAGQGRGTAGSNTEVQGTAQHVPVPSRTALPGSPQPGVGTLYSKVVSESGMRRPTGGSAWARKPSFAAPTKPSFASMDPGRVGAESTRAARMSVTATTTADRVASGRSQEQTLTTARSLGPLSTHMPAHACVDTQSARPDRATPAVPVRAADEDTPSLLRVAHTNSTVEGEGAPCDGSSAGVSSPQLQQQRGDGSMDESCVNESPAIAPATVGSGSQVYIHVAHPSHPAEKAAWAIAQPVDITSVQARPTATAMPYVCSSTLAELTEDCFKAVSINLHALICHDGDANRFLFPVDETFDNASNYNSIISDPQDLSNIYERLKGRVTYKDPHCVNNAVQQMFRNACIFSPNPAHPVHLQAVELKAMWDKKWAQSSTDWDSVKVFYPEGPHVQNGSLLGSHPTLASTLQQAFPTDEAQQMQGPVADKASRLSSSLQPPPPPAVSLSVPQLPSARNIMAPPKLNYGMMSIFHPNFVHPSQLQLNAPSQAAPTTGMMPKPSQLLPTHPSGAARLFKDRMEIPNQVLPHAAPNLAEPSSSSVLLGLLPAAIAAGAGSRTAAAAAAAKPPRSVNQRMEREMHTTTQMLAQLHVKQQRRLAAAVAATVAAQLQLQHQQQHQLQQQEKLQQQEEPEQPEELEQLEELQQQEELQWSQQQQQKENQLRQQHEQELLRQLAQRQQQQMAALTRKHEVERLQQQQKEDEERQQQQIERLQQEKVARQQQHKQQQQQKEQERRQQQQLQVEWQQEQQQLSVPDRRTTSQCDAEASPDEDPSIQMELQNFWEQRAKRSQESAQPPTLTSRSYPALAPAPPHTSVTRTNTLKETHTRMASQSQPPVATPVGNVQLPRPTMAEDADASARGKKRAGHSNSTVQPCKKAAPNREQANTSMHVRGVVAERLAVQRVIESSAAAARAVSSSNGGFGGGGKDNTNNSVLEGPREEERLLLPTNNNSHRNFNTSQLLAAANTGTGNGATSIATVHTSSAVNASNTTATTTAADVVANAVTAAADAAANAVATTPSGTTSTSAFLVHVNEKIRQGRYKRLLTAATNVSQLSGKLVQLVEEITAGNAEVKVQAAFLGGPQGSKQMEEDLKQYGSGSDVTMAGLKQLSKVQRDSAQELADKCVSMVDAAE